MSSSRSISNLPSLQMPNSIPNSTPSSHGSGDEIHDVDCENETIDAQSDPFVNGGKRKLTSTVWTNFKREKINGEWVAKCINCNKILSVKGTGDTSHLHQHLKRCPRRQFHDLKQMLQKKKTKTGEVEIATFKFDQDSSRKDLINMVILHEYPLSVVEHVGFHNFVSGLQPLFKIPSRSTLKRDIMKLYDYERDKTQLLFEKNNGRFALTMDMWTSNNQRKGFMAITAHFVDNSWTLQSRIMRFVHVPCPHTSEMLADVMMDCLIDWNIERKVSTLTVDNCSTNNALIPILREKISPGGLLFTNGDWFHIRCAAHILNLVVRDGLDVINDGIARIRDSVAYWTASPKREERFFETACQMNVGSTKKLALDCKTRWNSTYLMIRSALIYKDVFPRLRQRDSQYKCVPTDEDWRLGKEISDRLEVFYLATEQFSGTKYPTASNFLPTVCEIRSAITDWSSSSCEKIKEMALSMSRKFDSYWSDFHGILIVASILDPRFKMKFIEFLFPILYGEESNNEVRKVNAALSQIVTEYETRHKTSLSSASTYLSPGSSSSQPTMGHSRGKTNVMAMYGQFISSASPVVTPVRRELDYYLKEPVTPMSDDFDILKWWCLNANKYPILHCIARDILAIPVSTVASESAFGTDGRFVSPHRNRLHPKTLEALMCIQDWLWSEHGGSNLKNKIRGSFEEDEDDDDGEGPQGDASSSSLTK